jgi:tetratricopeptide (TPR) repeat protein
MIFDGFQGSELHVFFFVSRTLFLPLVFAHAQIRKRIEMSVEAAISQADSLYTASNVMGSFAALEAVANTEAGRASVEVQWRLARVYYLLAKECPVGTPDRERQFTAAHAAAETAIALEPAHGGAQKYAGITLSAMGEFKSTKDKIADAYKIKEHFEKGIAADPADATVYHCLGAWCFKVLQISMIERGIASVIFGSPPSSSYEECEKHLLKSADLNPHQIDNNLLLGDCYYQQSKYADAKKWYQQCLDCPATTKFQNEQQAKARAQVAKC